MGRETTAAKTFDSGLLEAGLSAFAHVRSMSPYHDMLPSNTPLHVRMAAIDKETQSHVEHDRAQI